MIKLNTEYTKGTFKIKKANTNCIDNPFPTNFQSIPFRFLLNKNDISNSEINPINPLKKEEIEKPEEI